MNLAPIFYPIRLCKADLSLSIELRTIHIDLLQVDVVYLKATIFKLPKAYADE
jgi:hypothetical protein